MESARQSAVRHLRIWNQWEPTWEEWLLLLLAVVAGALLASVLLFFLVPGGWPRWLVVRPPHCHRDSLVIPLNLKSSTSTYFKGLLVYSVPQEVQVVNGPCSCLAARGLS